MITFDNSKIRRQDRLLTAEEAYTLLKEGEYGVLSMITPEGTPYGVPVNYVWDGDGAIYIHCASDGRKLNCIRHNPCVSFCVGGHTCVPPDKFTTAYKSIVLACRAETGLDEDERWRALRMIIQKYSPQFAGIGEKYAAASFHRTEVIKLVVDSMSGKAKRVHKA